MARNNQSPIPSEIEGMLLNIETRQPEKIDADIRISKLKRFCPRLLVRSNVEEEVRRYGFPDLVHLGYEYLVYREIISNHPEWKVKIEKRFYYITTFDGNEIVITGKPDIAILDDKNKIHIIDIKTQKPKPADYYQVALYMYFLTRLTGKNAGEMALVKPPTYYDVYSYTPEVDTEIEDYLNSVLPEFINGNDVMQSNRSLCEGCELFNYCYAEQEVEMVNTDEENQIREAYLQMIELREQANDLKNKADAMRNFILSKINRAGVFNIRDISIKITEVEKEAVDVSKLKEKYPNIYEEVKKVSKYRTVK